MLGFSRPFYGLGFVLWRYPALKCWAKISRPAERDSGVWSFAACASRRKIVAHRVSGGKIGARIQPAYAGERDLHGSFARIRGLIFLVEITTAHAVV